MSDEEIIKLAREAGLIFNEDCGTDKARVMHETRVKIFASLIAAAEREACAELVDACDRRATPKGIAAAIRTLAPHKSERT